MTNLFWKKHYGIIYIQDTDIFVHAYEVIGQFHVL